ncbi:unnamed protein product, partial [Musa hybrid cultivar]
AGTGRSHQVGCGGARRPTSGGRHREAPPPPPAQTWPGSPCASTRWCGRAPAGNRSGFFGDIQRALCQRDHRPPAGSEVALCPDRSRNLADVRGFRQRFGPIIPRYSPSCHL